MPLGLELIAFKWSCFAWELLELHVYKELESISLWKMASIPASYFLIGVIACEIRIVCHSNALVAWSHRMRGDPRQSIAIQFNRLWEISTSPSRWRPTKPTKPTKPTRPTKPTNIGAASKKISHYSGRDREPDPRRRGYLYTLICMHIYLYNSDSSAVRVLARARVFDGCSHFSDTAFYSLDAGARTHTHTYTDQRCSRFVDSE